MRNNAAYLPESPIVYIILPKSIRNRASLRIFVREQKKSKMNTQGLSTIEEGIEDIKAGKILIVVDNEDRENEGDFIVAAEKVTPEIVNFMITNGRGVLCAPLTTSRCKELSWNR